MQADGLGWGEDPRPLARQAVAGIIESSCVAAIDAHLLRVAGRGETDRRNGACKHRILTGPGAIELCERRFREVRRRAGPMGVVRDRTSMGRILLAVLTRESKSHNVSSLFLLTQTI